MKRTPKILITMIIASLVLLAVSANTALYVGAPFFAERAHDEWHMNNYIVIPAFYAFVFCSFLAWWLGGLFTGAAIVAADKAPRKLTLAVALLIILACGFCTLGFNTFDFMLGCFYWTNGSDPGPISVLWFGINAWDYYFYLFLVPLVVSGFLFGFSLFAKLLRLKLQV